MKTDKNPNAKLSFLERFGYGLGDYAGNLVYSAISAFLLVYYTNVVGANAAAAASMIAVSKLLDGISDLIMGYIIDHTHSKWGKARPWIARLCIPLAVCTVLMFSVPSQFAGKAQIAYMFLTYNLVSTIFYTGINVPYATMHGLMTTNQYERGLLGNFRMLLATAGTMTINTVVLKMTGFFGGGDAYAQKGWTLTFVVLMLVFVVLNMFTFFVCRERVTEQSEEREKVSFVKGITGLLKNKYWVLMVVAQIVTMFFTPLLMKKVSKRNVFLLGMAISTIGFLMAGVSTDYVIICVSSVVKGIGFGCGGATMFGCLQDAITYGEWYNGYGTAGMGNAASSFCMKVGSGVGTAALGWILNAGGFDAAKDVQSASSLHAVTTAFVWVPIVTSVICVVCMLLFDLDKHYDQAVADLAQGKSRIHQK